MKNKTPILVSACLLGLPCRYDGKKVPCPAVLALREDHILIPFCPEQAGGLPTPRTPAERKNGCVITKDGRDVTEAYENGARMALAVCEWNGITHAILKERSPSCGSSVIYDGTHTGVLIPGMGTTAQTLREAGIPVISENEVEKLPKGKENSQ